MKNRILTAIVGMPLVLALIFLANPIPFAAFLAVICAVAWSESASIAGTKIAIPIAFIGGCLMTGLAFIHLWLPSIERITWALGSISVTVFALIIVAWTSLLRFRPMVVIANLLYVGIPLSAMSALHQLATAAEFNSAWHLANPVLFLLLPIWAGDTAAIFVGKSLGKHKLAPEISPSKTVEGSIANLLAACAASYCLGLSFGYPVWLSLSLGVVCGILGQVGDLFESWLKRRAGIKDSGTILPGHGGVLDRIDSLLFCSLPVLLLILFFAKL